MTMQETLPVHTRSARLSSRALAARTIVSTGHARCLFEPLEDRRLLDGQYDLAGGSFAVEQSALTAGEIFKVDWEVVNQGANPSSVYRVGVYAWREGNAYDTIYIFGHGTEYPSLPAGGSNARTQYLILPKNNPNTTGWWDDHGAGAYTIGMKILHGGNDSDPDNNGDYAFGKDKDTVTVDITDDQAPTASMITDTVGMEAYGETYLDFEIQLTDDVQLTYISGSYFNVTGPGGYDTTCYGGTTVWDDEYKKTATGQLSLTADGFWPDDEWGPDANGTYTVSVLPERLMDYTGNAAPAGVIGSFEVDISPEAPTADLSDPIDGGEIHLSEITGRKYIDVTFADHNGAGLYEWSIRDYDDEFELRYADGTTINHDGGGELVSGTTYRYEFYYSSVLQPGEVTVEYLAGTFRYNPGVENESAIQTFTIVADPVYGPTADLVNPTDGSTISVYDLEDQDYIDIRFVDDSGQGINAASILDDDPEFTVTGDASHVNQFDGTPVHVGGNVYRYEMNWRPYCGDLEINFIAGSFEDNAGNANEAETESFYVDGPDMYGVSFDVVELEANAGDELNFSARLRNDGIVAYHSFFVRFYVSRDPHIEWGEDEIVAVETVPGMNPDSEVTITASGRLPSAGDAIYNGDGVYYVGMIVDGDNANAETNENNNSNRGSYLDREDIQINNTEAADKPDLIAEFAAIPMEDVITPNQDERVSVRVVNLSEVPAKGLVAIQLFLSTDQTLQDHQYGGDKMAGGLVKAKLNLDELESKVFKVPFFSPVDITPGSYYLLAKVDYQEQMEELNENNNVVASPATYEWKRQVGEGGSKKLAVFDASGALVTFQMKGDGSAVIDPTDDGFDITVTGTTVNSSLKVSSKGHDFDLHDIHVSGDLKDLRGKEAILTGSLEIDGGVAQLQLGDVDDDHTITIGGSAEATPVKIQFGHVTDLVLNSDSPISQLKALSWTDNDAIADRIIAPWLGKLQIAGDFAAGLLLSGEDASGATLGNAKITGDLTGGSWNVTGEAGSVTAGSATADWSAAFTGKVSKMRFNGDVNGDLSALSIGKLDIRGSLAGATVRLNPAVDGPTTSSTVLGNLKITDWLDDSQIRAFGNVGKATIGGMRDSNLFAGVRNYVSGLASTATDFSHESSIAGVTIKGIAGADHCYLNSNIAAHLLSKVQVRNCRTDNGGTIFGIAARSLGRFQRSEPGNTIKWPNKDEPNGPAPDGDFNVRLI